ncbi:MAG: succinate dehydrogenase, cytochrome b556 subunit [Silvanigrellaceae bacterium]|nr:succinate dehydrogenase, cytochrome b556 subunit [Silvanigrellaceae bacterium]
MNKKRPINLDLGTMKFPAMAIASILHRVSGTVLFLLLPMILYFLSLSLKNAQSFLHLQEMVAAPRFKILLWVFGAALIYHLTAGIRHLLMDLGVGEGLPAGRYSALLVIGLSIVLTLLLGVWIW